MAYASEPLTTVDIVDLFKSKRANLGTCPEPTSVMARLVYLERYAGYFGSLNLDSLALPFSVCKTVNMTLNTMQ